VTASNFSSRIVTLIIMLLAVVLVLFDVAFKFEFSLPVVTEQNDASQDSRYQACYDERDAEIHHTAFGTIDNPDVQKEFIISGRAHAAAECRDEYPAQTKTVSTPFRFNLIDLDARFW
jgi:hypothetical protein